MKKIILPVFIAWLFTIVGIGSALAACPGTISSCSSPTYNALTAATGTFITPLPVASGGTGVAASTGTGSAVLSNSPVLVTPSLGTPSALTLTNATGLPAAGLGSIASETMLANTTGSSAPPTAATATSFFDNAYCSTVGYLLVRLTSVWTCAKGVPANPVWWGADPTGAASSLTAFNSALSASSSIIVPPGKYMFSGPLTYTLPNAIASVSITGSGQDNTILYFPTGNGIHIVYTTNDNSAHIRDLSVTTGAAGSGIGIELSTTVTSTAAADTPQSDITGVTIRGDLGYPGTADYWTDGILQQGVSSVLYRTFIEGSLSSQGNGIFVEGLPSSSTYAVDPIVAPSSYFGHLSIGIVYGSFSQGLMVIGSNFVGNTIGIDVPASETGVIGELTLIGSQMNDTQNDINASTLLSAAEITGNFFAVDAGDTPINGEFGDTQIIGNGFSSSAPTGTNIAIAFQSGSVADVASGNTINGFTTGIDIISGATHVNVQSNAYFNNTTNTINNGGGTNTIGGGSP